MNEWEKCVEEWATRCKEYEENCVILRGDVRMLTTQLGERDNIITALRTRLEAFETIPIDPDGTPFAAASAW